LAASEGDPSCIVALNRAFWSEYQPTTGFIPGKNLNLPDHLTLPFEWTDYPAPRGGQQMHISAESLIIILVVGLIAGWLAGQILQGSGFGVVGDIVIGVVGAFFGSWLLPQLGIHLGVGLVAAIINATIGAIILLVLISLIRNGSGWRGGRRGL
jgi:uncharacterized membrane protein YeaQ/YmgE (transglycosylase-associated protein family)